MPPQSVCEHKDDDIYEFKDDENLTKEQSNSEKVTKSLNLIVPDIKCELKYEADQNYYGVIRSHNFMLQIRLIKKAKPILAMQVRHAALA